ncbi:MAG: isoprenyl transferase [Planctomycetota bacterium]
MGRIAAKPEIEHGDAEQRDHRHDPSAQAAADAMRARCPKADPLGLIPDVHPTRIPRHIAIIMDGNGRWAESRGFPRVFGHRNGAGTVRDITDEALRLGVEQLTLYSFSSENWKRPAKEVDALMTLCAEYVEGNRDAFLRDGVRFRVIGRRSELPERVREAIDGLERATASCSSATLCLAINYGARAELVDATREIARRVAAGELKPDQIDESLIDRSLYTSGMPDPDLLIRTAGEMRVSNYLLWQISYAELYSTSVCWPEFSGDDLRTAIREFARRRRRFGGLSDELGPAQASPGGVASDSDRMRG